MRRDRPDIRIPMEWSEIFLLITVVFLAGGAWLASRSASRKHTEMKSPSIVATTAEAAQKRAAHAYESLPLSFEANRGQADPAVQFVARGTDYTLLLARDEAVLALQEQQDQDQAATYLTKMDPQKRKLFESSRYFRLSSRFRSVRKDEFVKIVMEGANSRAHIEPVGLLPGTSSYFIGNDPHKWRTGIPTYARVKYGNVYPGIDLVYYGNRSQLEFDFVLAPGADAKSIDLQIGAKSPLQIDAEGNLRVNTGDGGFRLLRPRIYQTKRGTQQLVKGGFFLRTKNRIGIQLAQYDHTRPLTIDPTLDYSTYFGGNGSDEIEGIAVDASGNTYITGQTTSTNFPVNDEYSDIPNAIDGIAFVSKLDPTGTAVLYSTYLGGTGGEIGSSIAVDQSGNAFVTGLTTSSNFPVKKGFQGSLGNPNGNAFVARINTTASGAASLVYSTYLGGGGNSSNPSFGDVGLGIAVDSKENAYVTGQTTSDDSVEAFPTSETAYQSTLNSTNGNAFLTVVDTAASSSEGSFVYSTYLGGDGTEPFGDYGTSVAVVSTGIVCLTGQTTSDSQLPFPTTTSAYQASLNSPYGNAFVTEINTTVAASAALVYSTYLGGSDSNSPGDYANGLAIDSSGNIYITGLASSMDFPTTSGAYQTTNSSAGMSFVAKLNPTQSGSQSLVYSTFLGGSGGEVGNSIAVDTSGDAFVAGSTGSANFPATSGAFETALMSSYMDAFLAEINPSETPQLIYATYVGGSCAVGDGGLAVALDSSGNPSIAGETCSTDFPTGPTGGVYQASLAGAQNGFITKFTVADGPDFSFSNATGGNCPSGGNCSTSATVTAGQTGTYNLQIAAVNDFNGAVALGCTDALAQSTCTVSPASVTVNGASTAAFTVTVTTAASSAFAPFSVPTIRRLRTRPMLNLSLLPFALIVSTLMIAARQYRRRLLPVFVLSTVTLVCLAGCGAGSNNAGANVATRSGTVMVSGTAGGVTHYIPLNLTVN